MPDLWTVGYEGRTPDAFAALLVANGVRTLVDVRELPLSRRKGFSKRSLAERLAEDGIAYEHLRDLGSPRDVRHAYRDDKSYETFAAAYTRHLERVPEAVARLEALARASPAAIMCVEATPEDCHRGILGERMAARGFRILHL